MFNFRKRASNNDKHPKPANENLPADANAKKPDAPQNNPPRKKLSAQFNAAVQGMRRLTLRDLIGTSGQTIKDLRQPKEIGLLIVAIIVPGGMLGWSAYRLQKFKSGENKAANENLPPPEVKPALPAPKADKKNAPPKGPGA